MARALGTIVSFALVFAAGATTAWFVLDPRADDAAQRVTDAERELANARMEVADWERIAQTERERKEVAEEEVGRLRRALDAPAPSPPPIEHPGPGSQEKPGVLPPESWDGQKLRIELHRLANYGRRMSQTPLLPAVVAASRHQGDEALKLLLDIVKADGLNENLRRAGFLVLQRLDDGRAVPTLIERYPRETTLAMQMPALQGLATLPGREQLGTLLDVWNRADTDPRLRQIAIHGLARRGHSVAVSVVEGTAQNSTGPLRARAIESLHSFVRADGYAARDLIPIFGKALVGADGDPQRRLALLALEGYWHTDAVEPLRAFTAQTEVDDTLRARGARIAGGIERQDPRPADAGIPRTARRADRSPAPVPRRDGAPPEKTKPEKTKPDDAPPDDTKRGDGE